MGFRLEAYHLRKK